MPAPQGLYSDAGAGKLEIVWDDASRQRFDIALLRQRCPCADCKSRRRRGMATVASAPPAIVEIRLIGAYAAQIVFSDGHDRGIFPWRYLKALEQESGQSRY